MAWNLMTNEKGRMCKEAVVANSGTILKGLRKTTNSLYQTV